MRIRLGLGIVPVLLATTAALAAPAPAAASAADGVTETGTVTYTVNVAKAEVDVTTRISITNQKKPTSCGPWCTTNYYYTQTEVFVEVEAAGVKATSNAGKVSMSLKKKNDYYSEFLVTYPAVYYRQTRVVTVTYAIPAAPHATGGYRAGKAYAELCANGNGYDSGTVNVLIPDGFEVNFYAGSTLTPSGDKNGFTTYTSGSVPEPYNYWSCLEAENPTALTSSTVTTGGQTFTIKVWPEDPRWGSKVSADVTAYVPKLEDLTGLTMPGGTIVLQEAGISQLGEYIGGYSPKTGTASIAENTDDATVAHELSHIWFNSSMFADTWMNEGLAVFSEQVAGSGNYTPCKDPGVAPGSATLNNWKYLDMNSTTADEDVVDWQYAESCWLMTDISKIVGPANFKAIIVAASKDEIPYVGAGPAEKSPAVDGAITIKALLDLIDERGMVPAGVKDLDETQTLLSTYDTALTKTDLTARSAARATYHALATSAGTWKMPYVIRAAMASWDWDTATSAMDTATKILALRAQIEKAASWVKLDGTTLQTQFEGAKTKSDLDSLLALAQKEADATATVNQAIDLNNGNHSLFQTVGLVGSDPASLIATAKTDLAQIKPDEAGASAQSAIDMINKSGDQGTVRVGAVVGALLALLLLVVFLVLFRRRRHRTVPAPFGPGMPMGTGPWGQPPAAGTSQFGVPYAGWQQPAPPSADWQQTAPPVAGWQPPAPAAPPATPYQPDPFQAAPYQAPAATPETVSPAFGAPMPVEQPPLERPPLAQPAVAQPPIEQSPLAPQLPTEPAPVEPAATPPAPPEI